MWENETSDSFFADRIWSSTFWRDIRKITADKTTKQKIFDFSHYAYAGVNTASSSEFPITYRQFSPVKISDVMALFDRPAENHLKFCKLHTKIKKNYDRRNLFSMISSWRKKTVMITTASQCNEQTWLDQVITNDDCVTVTCERSKAIFGRKPQNSYKNFSDDKITQSLRIPSLLTRSLIETWAIRVWCKIKTFEMLLTMKRHSSWWSRCHHRIW